MRGNAENKACTDIPLVTTWFGQDIEELSRDELLEAIQWLYKENESLRNDINRQRKNSFAIDYLMAERIV